MLKKNPEKILEAGITKGMMEKLAAGEEDAEFSKMLATIRRDAPINFVVPDKTWHEAVDADKVIDMLADFDFRSLLPRVKQILGGEVSVKNTGEKSSGPCLGRNRLRRPDFFSGSFDAAQDQDSEQGEGLFADEKVNHPSKRLWALPCRYSTRLLPRRHSAIFTAWASRRI